LRDSEFAAPAAAKAAKAAPAAFAAITDTATVRSGAA
jgi:hypothetical protein